MPLTTSTSAPAGPSPVDWPRPGREELLKGDSGVSRESSTQDQGREGDAEANEVAIGGGVPPPDTLLESDNIRSVVGGGDERESVRGNG